MREHLSKGLGFSKEDRDINVRRIGYVVGLVAKFEGVAVVAAISPYQAIRDELKQKIGNFIEVFLDVPLEVCESRDVKGLYAKARSGAIGQFTGVTDPYEPPLHPDVVLKTHQETLRQSVDKIILFLVNKGYLEAHQS